MAVKRGPKIGSDFWGILWQYIVMIYCHRKLQKSLPKMDLALNGKKINMSKSMILKKNSKCEKKSKKEIFCFNFPFF
jgi:hypothetical protein